LTDRYESSKDDKDKRALDRFENHFDNDIDGLINNKYGLTYVPLNITEENPYPFEGVVCDLVRDVVFEDFRKDIFKGVSKDEIRVNFDEGLFFDLEFIVDECFDFDELDDDEITFD